MNLHRASGRHRLGFALASCTMLLWGVLPLALAVVLRRVDAVTITWFRFLVSTVILGAALSWRRKLPALRRLSPGGWGLLLLATAGLAGNYWTFLVGLELTSPATAQVLIQLAALLFALGGLVVFGEHFTRLQWSGFAAIVVGLGVFFASQLRELVEGLDRYLAGALVLVGSSVSWAAYGLAQKQLLRNLPSQAIMLCIYAGSALAFTPAARPASLADLAGFETGILLFCALNTALAYGAFSEALQHWDASRVSSVLALTPLATLGTSWLVQRATTDVLAPDPISPASLAGACLVVAGSMTTALGGARRRVTPDGAGA